jgi:hypothetical protein
VPADGGLFLSYPTPPSEGEKFASLLTLKVDRLLQAHFRGVAQFG